jgi:hypothetical protein
MGGIWRDEPIGHESPKGELWSLAEDGVFRYFDDWKEMEAAYYFHFERLKALGRVRTAFLRKNDQTLHSWCSPNNED